MSNFYENMPYFEEKIKRVYHAIVNSKIWFHLYYKHTKEWKKLLSDVESRAIASRKRALKEK